MQKNWSCTVAYAVVEKVSSFFLSEQREWSLKRRFTWKLKLIMLEKNCRYDKPAVLFFLLLIDINQV